MNPGFRFSQELFFEIRKHDFGALFCEFKGDRLANASAGACDESDFVFKYHSVSP
jgi:hypothetical protein